jgi:hypothetical protein
MDLMVWVMGLFKGKYIGLKKRFKEYQQAKR